MTLLLEATLETLFMTFVATGVGVGLGLPLAAALYVTQNQGLYENPVLYKGLGFLINGVRSIPYIILIIALIPMTRVIAGSSIGTVAACVPLSIASIMLVARLGEESFRTVPRGLIEAALAMGARRFDVLWKVVLPECLPNLVSGMTLTTITLIGFSAMAGAIGGGGLGDLAVRYGYQRYQTEVIFQIVFILILMVQTVQMLGDGLARRLEK